MPSTRKTKRNLKLKPQPIEFSIPNHFRCPVSLDLMHDPVIVSTGITYDRHSIETWLDTGNSTCPVTNQNLLLDQDPIPNHSLRRMIQDWCVENHLNGIERIATPKVPLTFDQAFEILSEISAYKNLNMVGRVRMLAKESEKNRRCFVSVGAACVLAKLFSEASNSSVILLEEILSTLVCFLPLEYDASTHFASRESLNNITSVLKFGNLNARLHAMEVLKEVLYSHRQAASVANDTDGLAEELMEVIKSRTSTKATKIALAVSYYMISFDTNIATRFVELGIVPLILELIVDADKSVCEKGLIVFHAICGSERGREEARGHALCVALLVKKMFRVSDIATEFVISVLWELCKDVGGEEVVKEAVEVGGFQKVLLLLQVGCGLGAKEKATRLLKLMNGCDRKFECVDVMDFKGLKRSF